MILAAIILLVAAVACGTASLYAPNWRWLIPAIVALVSGFTFLTFGVHYL